MSTLIDKNYLLLPEDVLWNLTRLSRFALFAVNIKENSDKATMSLTFDKTSLAEDYTKTLQEKFKMASPALESDQGKKKSLLTFDHESPLKPPLVGEELLKCRSSQAKEKDNLIQKGGTPQTENTMKVKQEPMSPKVNSDQTEDLKVSVKVEKEVEKGNTEGRRPMLSFPLPTLKTMSSNALMSRQSPKSASKKSKEGKSKPVIIRQCAMDLEADKLTSKLSKMSVKDRQHEKEMPTKKEEKVKKLSPPKSYSDKENKTLYRDTVEYYLDKAHRNIDSDPKLMSKFDYTYSIKDGKDFGKFVIEWSDDLKKHPKVSSNDRVTFAWLKSNSKNIPSYIRKQATYRLIEKEFDLYSVTDVVPREKRRLIADLLD